MFGIGSRCNRLPFRITKGGRTRGCDTIEGLRVTGLHQPFDSSIHGVKVVGDVNCHRNKLEGIEGSDEVEDLERYGNTEVFWEE